MNQYFLDTNIILDNFENLITLSDNGTNVILLSNTVLSELDSKKTSEGAIGYNAREFFRVMEKTKTVEKERISENLKRIVLNYSEDLGFVIEIHLISLNEFSSNEKNTDIKNLNDARIIETAKEFMSLYSEMKVVSNDIAFRANAIFEDIFCESFKTDNKKVSELGLFESINVPNEFVLPVAIVDFEKYIDDCSNLCAVELVYESGLKLYGYREGDMIFEVDEDAINHQIAKPLNARQKVLSNMIISDTNDIIVAVSKAGGGKNTVITSGCCALMDRKHSPYEGIVYVRANIDSIEDKDQQLGFLPGSLDEKFGPYLRPLNDTIDTLVRIKYKAAIGKNKNILFEKTEEFKEKYNISFEAINFLRGATIKNKLLIIDEAQNLTISAIKLILTRIGENCKVFILGDINQIDSKYLNSRNNGLTHMMNKVGNKDIRIVGMEFNKTIRSRVAAWAADYL